MPKVPTRWRYTPASGQWLMLSPWFVTVKWRQSIKKLVKEIQLLGRKEREEHLLPDVASQSPWQSEKWDPTAEKEPVETGPVHSNAPFQAPDGGHLPLFLPRARVCKWPATRIYQSHYF